MVLRTRRSAAGGVLLLLLLASAAAAAALLLTSAPAIAIAQDTAQAQAQPQRAADADAVVGAPSSSSADGEAGTNATAGGKSGGTDHALLVTYAAIIAMASACVWFGAGASLAQLGAREGDEAGAPSGWAVDQVETMSSSDAMWFPVMGSCALLSMYLAFKYLSKELINTLLTAYFLIFGTFAMMWTLKPLVLLPLPMSVRKNLPRWNKTFTGLPSWLVGDEPVEIDLDAADGVALLIAAVLGWQYWLTGNWIISNILGASFSIQGIALINIGAYKTGCILLSGLFFYDVWWVFGTDVMVTVAKNFDVPIKLVFPRNIMAAPADMQFSMLGLGDIVIPGIFVALLLRFDANRARLALARSATGRGKSASPDADPALAAAAAAMPVPRSFPRPYFLATYAAYVGALVFTIVIMHVFKAAQPALLYLVPGCIGASSGLALVRGEFKELFNYSEEKNDDDDDDDEDDKDKDKDGKSKDKGAGASSPDKKKD